MKCDPEECGYCREDNPKIYCSKLGMELPNDAKEYHSMFCGE